MQSKPKSSKFGSGQRYFSVKSFNSFGGVSFRAKEPDTKQAGILLDFLTEKLPIYRSNNDEALIQTQFETITIGCTYNCRDPEFMRVLKACGWTGNRYSVPKDSRLDIEFCIQLLSNYYLRAKNTVINMSVSGFNLNASGNKKSPLVNFSLFCPNTLIDIIKLNSQTIQQPTTYPLTGACMLADISGFSKYSGAMCSKGVTGLDELRSVTDGLLNSFVQTVYNYGGDVMAFAGDALICIFPDDDIANSTAKGNCCARALVCGSLLCKDDSHHLPMHVAISFGQMELAVLGGLHDQWVSILTGDCINDLSECINNAGPKEVAATASCIAKLDDASRDMFSTQPCAAGSNLVVTLLQDSHQVNHRLQLVRMLSRSGDEEVLTYGIEEVSALIDADAKKQDDLQLASTLSKFVPKPVKNALRGGILDSIGELRQVTTLFLSLDSYDKEVEGRDPLKLQAFFATAQEHLHVSGGFLRQFLVDDKGCVLIAMWGVPTFTYANNCSRALYFAVAMRHSAVYLNHAISIGVSTGLVFCGCVGTDDRKDYVGIGTDVNLAARLMSKAKGRILLDNSTYQNSNQATRLLLSPAEKLLLKGMSKPMVPFQYDSDALPPLSEPDQLDSNYLLQRRATTLLDKHLDLISNSDVLISELDGLVFEDVDLPKSAVFVLGPAGCGKSMATHYFRQGAQKRGMKEIVLQVQSFHKGVPYSVARMLFRELIHVDNEDEQQLLLKGLLSIGFPHYDTHDTDLAYRNLVQIIGRAWDSSSSAARPVTLLSKLQLLSDDDTGSKSSGDFLILNSRSQDPVDGSSTRVKHRKQEKFVLCKVLQLLLARHGPYAVCMVNGHLCDELSWKLIDAVFAEKSLQLLLMVTVLIRINVSQKDSTGASARFQSRASISYDARQNSDASDVDELLDNLSKSVRSIRPPNILTNNRQHSMASDIDYVDIPQDLTPTHSNSMRSRITRRLESELPNGCLTLMSRKCSDVLELGGLNIDEVRDILHATLHVDEVSESLLRMVMDVSSGNPFWCKTIAAFIKDRGMSELEAARKKSEKESQDVLKTLVICRLEHLSFDEIVILKHASIIGYDFSYKLLQSIVPPTVFKSLDECTGKLVEEGFIKCFEEVPELKFCFANQMFQTTVYELMPPTDAALVHQTIAEYVEVAYHDHLQPYYPLLGYHYKHSGEAFHDQALKYETKSADQAISQGAFTDGLVFAKSAFAMAQHRPELSVLLSVLQAGIEDLSCSTPTNSNKHNRSITREYKYLKASVEKSIAQKQKAEKRLISKSLSVLNAEEEEEDLRKQTRRRAQSAHTLTWQPSYTVKRKSEQNMSSNMEQQAPPQCCTPS